MLTIKNDHTKHKEAKSTMYFAGVVTKCVILLCKLSKTPNHMHQGQRQGFGIARYMTCPCIHVVGPSFVGTQNRLLMPDVYSKMEVGAKSHLVCNLSSSSTMLCMRYSTWPHKMSVLNTFTSRQLLQKDACPPQRQRVSYTLDPPKPLSRPLVGLQTEVNKMAREALKLLEFV
jgi:hypothetical protein